MSVPSDPVLVRVVERSGGPRADRARARGAARAGGARRGPRPDYDHRPLLRAGGGVWRSRRCGRRWPRSPTILDADPGQARRLGAVDRRSAAGSSAGASKVDLLYRDLRPGARGDRATRRQGRVSMHYQAGPPARLLLGHLDGRGRDLPAAARSGWDRIAEPEGRDAACSRRRCGDSAGRAVRLGGGVRRPRTPELAVRSAASRRTSRAAPTGRCAARRRCCSRSTAAT